ncbi:MAG: spore maturation protein [Paludibacteraceae bacterium]|nr:spore maturation protein [Paludibacteraceae bacterium]MBR2493020.1 spore maturation protein [Paludibacteraceae bacterium]MBR3871285.1 spore maturation protein [Paludibacteraceae bacterium]MBR6685967.1 spore maturation protein [Paludibacteraceae bacterium]
MVLNYIWAGFFIIAFIVALIQFFIFGDNMIFAKVVDSTFEMSEFAVMDIALPLVGVMTLWLGLMNIGERAGCVRFLSKIIGPFFTQLFPEVPKNHPVHGQLLMNFSANMLGLDNAATPLGLKAMNSLQELNPNKDTASNAQIMFLALNTSGLTIIPIAIMAQRSILGAANPTDIFIPLLISTYCSTLIAILYVGIKQKLRLLNKIFISWIGGITALIAGLVWYVSTLDREEMMVFSSIFSNGLLLLIIIAFIGGALYKKVNVFEAFIDGAKEGFTTCIKIIPYMVGMLVGIAVFRASGAMDLLIMGIEKIVSIFTDETEFIGALPTAFMKPLSGSGAKAMMVEAMKTYGVDSFVGRLSCLFQGAADTTFYIIALYFGSVGIKKTRYAVSAGLIADLGGVIAAILIGYLFFG